MATHQLKGGHPPKESVLKTWNLALRLLWMVTYHPQDGHSLSLGRSPSKKNMITLPTAPCSVFEARLTFIFQIREHIMSTVTNLPENGHPLSKYGHQSSPGWSTTIPRRVPHHPKESCPSSLGGSPTVPRIGLHTIPMMVTHQQYKANHHPQDCYHFPQHSHPSSQVWSTRLGV